MKKLIIWCCSGWFLAAFLSGCSAPRVSETGRTAVEQFLLSTVVERGIGSVDFSQFSEKKVFVDYDYLESQVDKSYIKGVVEMRMAEQGLIVCRDIKEADYIVQVLCGVLATDTSKLMIGTPSLPIPIPDTSISVAIPEIPVFQKLTRSGFGRFSFNILEAPSRKPVKVIPGVEASTYYTNWTILLVPFKSYDMPLQIKEGTQTSFDLDY
ncbi:MAG: hypothetical protein E7047_01620 [Lentisphaerae bacterium]|nr:hypothetical protein [Lentisphaerota bacterium]